MRISPTPQPGEESLNAEGQAFFAYLRSLPQVPDEEDPNDWFSQIAWHLKLSPKRRLERWAAYADNSLRLGSERRGEPHVRFDPLRVLRTLTEGDVLFVLVGMGAGYVQGAPYPSYNTDVTPKTDPDKPGQDGTGAGLFGGTAFGERTSGGR